MSRYSHDSYEGWDVAQVCLNGHIITMYAKTMPKYSEEFCGKCGEKTVT
jgi:hypothetical protein